MAVANLHSLPAGLDALCAAIGVPGKLSEGKLLIHFFNNWANRQSLVEALRLNADQLRAELAQHVNPDGKTLAGHRAERLRLDGLLGVLDKWETYKRYCQQDTEILMQAYRRLPKMPETEQALWVLDQRINDRGVLIDLDLAEAADAKARQIADASREQLSQVTGIANPRSIPQLKAWLKDCGLEPESLDKEHVAELLASDIPEKVRWVLKTRSQITSSSVAKFSALRDRTCLDGRARGCFRYFGAHTGRFSSVGIQLQNLPRIGKSEIPRITGAEIGRASCRERV